MRGEGFIFLFLVAVALIPVVCLLLSMRRTIVERFRSVGAFGLLLLIPCVIIGSTKPPPPQPPSEGVKVQVCDISTRSITIVPYIPEDLRDELDGAYCEVQIKRVGVAGDWETITAFERYDLQPRVIPGTFVAGGALAVRKLRLVWPSVGRELEILK